MNLFTARIAALFLASLLAAACGTGGSPENHPHGAHRASSTPASPATKMHGSHDPAHGGMVLMDGHDHHAELVLDPTAGAHRVYVSDGARATLPASTFDSVTLTITPAKGAPERIAMTRVTDDSHWVASGKPLSVRGSKVKLTYTKGAETLYDVEFDAEYVLTGKVPIAAAHGGHVAAIEGGHLELIADASGAYKVWLFDDNRAPLPPDAAKVSVTTSQKGYGTVALSPSGDHVAGSGKPLKGGHATATVTVERGGQVATTNIALHLEGGHHGH